MRIEDAERNAAIAEQRAAAQRQDAITRYGETLGEAYFNYAYRYPRALEEWAEYREAFADAIVTVLESGTHEERVRGMTALLSSFEERIAPVARQADAADLHTRVIG